jgi:hypothetical protein
MEQVSLALEPMRVFLAQIGVFVPRLLIAVIILIAGAVVAKVGRFIAVRGLRAVNFNVLTERAGIDDFLRQGGTASDTTEVLGTLIYWLIVLAALMIAFNSLGMDYVTDLIGRIILFIPRVIVAVLILAVGAYFARFVATAITTYAGELGSADADILGRIAFFAIMLFVVVISLDQIGIGVDILRDSFLILLGGLVLALAIAFGLGGKDWARRVLDRWMPPEEIDRDRRPPGSGI